MTTISNISDVLGGYMLKGWVLTDQTCPTPGCVVPLMRSPKGRTPVTTFCASCSTKNLQEAQPQNIEPTSPSNLSSESYISRSSTPPTEISEATSSSVFAPPPETAETRRRREQSDRASSEIGKKLLKGWALLGEECLNESCYGIPLVRPPKSGNDKDSRKQCVICDNIYTTMTDSSGRETLTLFNAPSISPNSVQSQRRVSPKQFQASSQPATAQRLSMPSVNQQHSQIGQELLQLPQSFTSPILAVSPDTILDESSRALQTSLQALSRWITALSSSSAPNLASIGQTADTIGKVTAALAQVRQVQWCESRAKIPCPLDSVT